MLTHLKEMKIKVLWDILFNKSDLERFQSLIMHPASKAMGKRPILEIVKYNLIQIL